MYEIFLFASLRAGLLRGRFPEIVNIIADGEKIYKSKSLTLRLGKPGLIPSNFSTTHFLILFGSLINMPEGFCSEVTI